MQVITCRRTFPVKRHDSVFTAMHHDPTQRRSPASSTDGPGHKLRIQDLSQNSSESGCWSVRSNESMESPIAFGDRQTFPDKSLIQHPSLNPSESGCLSLRSNQSMESPLAFGDHRTFPDKSLIQHPSPNPFESGCCSLRSNKSMESPLAFRNHRTFPDGSMLEDQSAAIGGDQTTKELEKTEDHLLNSEKTFRKDS
ncbi:hypothetical protein FQA47_013035 [Oryzias melastigma]|uniref:Uncharacterized protein n=1 Tax=Oryzias melastigma TaxID=30732 RepID=A0A834L0T0_ORYME|nr:hypothetical protein FQA47_013035 [Oryzias melastigma]